MTKRIIGLVLALCLIVGLLPMIALAEETEKTATLVVTTGNADAKVQWKPTLSEGMAAAYAKTTAEGALVLDGASEADYNLKVEWAADGTPTLTMKGATLTNDNIYPDKIDTIVIGGTADFIVKIDGTNVINGNPANTSTTSAAYRCATGFAANNKGTLTFQGGSKLNDTLTIDNKGGNGIIKTYNALTIDKCAVIINCVNTGSNAQNGIILVYEEAGREDLCNLTVTSAKLDITAGSYHGQCAIMVTKSNGTSATSTSNVNSNTGDILFKDSVIRLYRSNGTSSTQVTSSLVALGSGSTFTIDNCDVTMYSRHIIARYAPVLKNVQNVFYKPESGTQTDWSYDAGAYIGTTKITTFKTTHICSAAADDGDCTTANTCIVCGIAMDTAQTAHTPAADDGDCTTDILCANEGCKQVAVPGAASHTPEADDGDVTTEVKCSVCGTVTTPAIKPSIRFNYEIPGTSTYVVMNAGDAPKYWTTGEYSPTYYAGTFYMKETTDATNWNVKLEYPANGVPTMTLKNAKIVEGRIITFTSEGTGNGSTPFPGDVNLIIEGDNYLACDNAYTSDIHFNITGTATISGTGKLKINHALNSSGKSGLIHSKGGLTLDNVDVELDLPSAYARVGAGLVAENGNLTIKGSKLDIVGYNPYASDVKDPETGNVTIRWSNYRPIGAALKTSGNLIIEQGSNVRIIASSSNSDTQSIIKVGGTVTLRNSDLEVASVSGTYLKVFNETTPPTLTMDYTGGFTAITSTSKGTYVLDTDTYTAPSNTSKYTDLTGVAINKLNYLKVTHSCYSANDDKNCTTVENCDLCGKAIGTALTHVAGTDDGDCTTAVLCANAGCEQVVIQAATAHTGGTATCKEKAKCATCGKEYGELSTTHTPNADDGDCTTAITCSICGTETTAGAASHTGGTATCKDKAKCTTCGKEYGELLTTHTPNADDGDCTTAITCSICGTETTPAATHTGGTATCKDKAKCATCGKEYGELSTTHTPDTRTDCTVDTMCTVCGEVAISAGSHAGGTATCKDKAKCATCGKEYGELSTTHTGGTATCKDKAVCTVCNQAYGELLTTHTPNADDGDCTTAITCSICGTETTPAATHTGGTATCKDKAKCATCGKEYGELSTTHTPAADDGDCTTAIKCTVCDAETTAAKTAHTYTDDKDTTCDNAGCTKTRTVTSNPQTGDNANLTVLFALMLICVVGFTGVTVLRKKEF